MFERTHNHVLSQYKLHKLQCICALLNIFFIYIKYLVTNIYLLFCLHFFLIIVEIFLNNLCQISHVSILCVFGFIRALFVCLSNINSYNSLKNTCKKSRKVLLVNIFFTTVKKAPLLAAGQILRAKSVAARIIYVGYIDSMFTNSFVDKSVSHLFTSLLFVFPALKSPAAFHEQRKSLERSKVRTISNIISQNPSKTKPCGTPRLQDQTNNKINHVKKSLFKIMIFFKQMLFTFLVYVLIF